VSVRDFAANARVTLGLVTAFDFGTVWAVVQFDSVTSEQAVVVFGRVGNTQRGALKINASGQMVWQAGATVVTSTATASTATWYIWCVTKATGTATPVAHIYNFSTQTWTHQNLSGTVANSNTLQDNVYIGRLVDDSFALNGRIAAAGYIQGTALSDANCETLLAGVARWFGHSPNSVWQLTQDDTAQTIVDLTGNGGNQSALTNTSVDSDNSPIPLIGPVKAHHRRLMGAA
jgi:hypothetical protein